MIFTRKHIEQWRDEQTETVVLMNVSTIMIYANYFLNRTNINVSVASFLCFLMKYLIAWKTLLTDVKDNNLINLFPLVTFDHDIEMIYKS